MNDKYKIHALLLNMDFKSIPQNPKHKLLSPKIFTIRLTLPLIPLI